MNTTSAVYQAAFSFLRPARFSLAICLLSCLILPLAATAEEPAEKFLEGLKQRGYHDMAVEYLDQIDGSNMVDQRFMQRLKYEKGVTIVEAARRERDLTAREKSLNSAQKELDAFVKADPNHPLVPAANNFKGNILVERGRMKIEQAKKAKTPDETKALNGQARQHYDDAYKVFSGTKDTVGERLKTEFAVELDPNNRRHKRLVEVRDQLRASYLQSQLLAAAILEETADAATGAEKTKMLTEAATQYESIAKKYRTRIAGLYAKLYQARCNAKQDKHKEALSLLTDLFDQPAQPDAFRTLKVKTLQQAIDSWFAEKKYLEAIEKLTELLETANRSEDNDPDWLELKFGLARAHYEQAAEYKKADPKNRDILKNQKAAAKWAREVLRVPNPQQKEARELITELGPGVAPAGADRRILTFDDARQAAKESFGLYNAARSSQAKLKAQLAQAPAGKKAELQADLAEAAKAEEASFDEALSLFKEAVTLADDDTSLEDINLLRYYICYLFYVAQDYASAAVQGEFVARRYPGSSASRQCAKIAMAAWVKLYKEAKGDDSFEKNQCIEITKYIASQWAGEPEGAEAVNTLIPFMVRANRLDEAWDYVSKIPASPNQATLKIKIGQARWAQYQTGKIALSNAKKKLKAGETNPAIEAEEKRLAELAKKGAEGLKEGFASLKNYPNGANASLTLPALAYGQAMLDSGESKLALEAMTNPTYGCVTLSAKNHPETQRTGFKAAAYTTGLRAAVSSLGGGDQAAGISQIKSMMTGLKQALGAAGSKQAVGIYYLMAQDLEKKMKNASAGEKSAMADGFKVILTQISQESGDLPTLNWVADSFLKLGEELQGGSGSATSDAKPYYQQAAKSLQVILDKDAANSKFLSDNLEIGVQLKLGKVKQRLGDYEAALDIYTKALRKKSSMLNVQVDAAQLYQDWADSDPAKHGEKYKNAIGGGAWDPAAKKFHVWGWGKLAQVTQRYPQYSDTFLEASYKNAQARVKLADITSDGGEKKKHYEGAKRSILRTMATTPELGGPDMFKKFDAVYTQVQKGLGAEADGLAAEKARQEEAQKKAAKNLSATR